jgi:flagellar FliL protein
MADHAAAATAGATKPSAEARKRNVVLIALVAANMLGMFGLGGYLVLGAGGEPAHAEDVDEESDEEEGDEAEGDEEEGEHEMGPLVEFESIVVNLSASTTDRYLKLTFELELRGEDQLEHVESHMAAYRDAVLMHLTSLTVEEVQGAENAVRLRERLLEMTHTTFGRRAVSHVYITEYLVQ